MSTITTSIFFRKRIPIFYFFSHTSVPHIKTCISLYIFDIIINRNSIDYNGAEVSILRLLEIYT